MLKQNVPLSSLLVRSYRRKDLHIEWYLIDHRLYVVMLDAWLDGWTMKPSFMGASGIHFRVCLEGPTRLLFRCLWNQATNRKWWCYFFMPQSRLINTNVVPFSNHNNFLLRLFFNKNRDTTSQNASRWVPTHSRGGELVKKMTMIGGSMWVTINDDVRSG